MSSENKLEKRNLDSYNYTDNQTLKDSQDVSQDNTITTVLEVALIAATSIGLYKSGALKPIAKPLAEFADKLARDGTDKAGVAMTTLKEWSNLKHLSPAEFEMSTQNFNAPKEPSIFRDRKSTGFYDLLEDAKDFIDTGKPNFYNVKKLINGSVEDINLLTEMISENEAKIKDIQSNYSNSELSFRFNEMFDFEKTAAHYSESQSLQFSNKATEAFMNLMKLDKKEAQQQLKEMGYRKMTLGDIAELKEKDGKRSLHLKDEIPLDLNEGGKKELETLIRKANGFFDSANIHHRYVKNGEPTSGLKSGDWADIIIDHDIRINKEGTKVIDYRMSHKNAIGFLHSLANDFKLPVVQFNPFKTFGFDKVGRKDPLLGLINNQQYDPNITRIGKEKTIQSWLVDKFGETYKDKSVAVIAGKAYTTDDFGRLQELGDNFKLHDITYANSGYGLKSRLNATRQMAGLSLGEADKMITEEYMKFYKEKTGKDLSSFQKAKYNLGKMFDIGYQEVRVGDRDSVHMGLDSATSIDEATNKFINWMTDRPFFKTNGFEYADTEEMIQNVTRNNHKTLFGEGFASYSTPNNVQRNPRMYATTKKGFKLHKAFKKAKDGDKDAAMKELTGFIKQFDPVNAGRRSDDTIGEYFTETSAIPLIILNQLSEGLGDSSKLFGLSVESKRSTYVLAENLLLKRALPVYLATKIPGVINYMSEPFFGSEDDDETGNRDNITKVFFRNVLKPIDIAAHKAMDLTSATKVFKFLGEMTPGSEQISELPGIHMLGLGQTEEERKEYIESGYDPIRKGRYWGSGNAPFTGGKITYWRPNLYRRVEADVQFSDSKWGSRQEYYNNTWFPNPVNPLAPLNHFFLDRNHYDKKHYQDRPYLQTSPEGQNIPLIGPLFGATIGKIINPQQKMHMEYWKKGFAIDPEDEKASPLLTTGFLNPEDRKPKKSIFPQLKLPYISFTETNVPSLISKTPKSMDNSQQDIGTYNKIESDNAEQTKNYSNSLYTSAYQAKEILSKGFMDKAGIIFQQTRILPKINIGGIGSKSSEETVLPGSNESKSTYQFNSHGTIQNTYVPKDYDYDPTTSQYEAYSTPSGSLNIVDVPDSLNLWKINKDIQRYSLNKVFGTNQRVTIDDINGPGIPIGNDDEKIDNAFIYSLGEQFNWLGDVAGLKGFALQQFVTGHPNEDSRVIEDSGYAYSINNDFWNQNLGGFGGNLSEITRRFIPKRNNKTEYVNPIRNTMPSWMPGSSYFTDFKHGDVYTKVENGEERLPGEGYERLHHMNDLMELNIGSSNIGYDKGHIVRHMLNLDDDKTEDARDTLSTGTKIHKRIEQNWLDAGIAIDTEMEIDDKRNGILGYYDALVHDRTSKTGKAIVDIKTTSAKNLEKYRKEGMPLDYHKRQVNYYLWATGNTESKGYIYYVDKENLNNNYTVGFNFDQKMLEDTLKNVHEARSDIRKAVASGEIGRGDLYSNIEKFRILADTAPYSQEFKDASARLDNRDLTASEEREVSAIRDRLQQQKEPLRVYDYKFKTSNLKPETVTITKVIDNNTFLTKEYGKEHAIRFAGIRVSESNSEMYNKKQTKDEAAKAQLKHFIKPGRKVKILYDADEQNKYANDSVSSIRAVVMSKGRNVNKHMLSRNLATEKETDDSPAGVQARYTKGEIAFGSAMENLTHDIIGNIPFIGSKFMQVRSPYEQYRKREVYSKDFQSWNHPIRDILMPHIDETIANDNFGGVLGIVSGAFIGSMFGRKKGFGKLIGAVVGGSITAAGKVVYVAGSTKERAWRPQRRKDQENLNEYVDTLKYVKNMRLYEQYKLKAMKENNFDVEAFMKSRKSKGIENKLKKEELTEYKKTVKLDFKHRDRYNFKYGKPKYLGDKMNKEETIKAINKELGELQGERSLTKLPKNVIKAIEFKQTADQTVYGYKAGDSLVNIMTALPKKERQYFKHFIDAPEEEKDKILRIAPSYLRRALQSVWGRHVDEKPSLQEYFQSHALPDQNWVGWDENTDMNDIKVKLVHQNKLDPGEFDIWDDGKRQADETNIPIPAINKKNSARQVQARLNSLLGHAGYNDVQTNFINSSTGDKTEFTINRDARNDVEQQIKSMQI